MIEKKSIEKIIYHDTWFDMMTMSPGGKIKYELFSDGSIRVERISSEEHCVEKTASKMAGANDYQELCLRLNRYLEKEEIFEDVNQNALSVEIIDENGDSTEIFCGEKNLIFGDMVWEYIQSYAMTSDAYI